MKQLQIKQILYVLAGAAIVYFLDQYLDRFLTAEQDGGGAKLGERCSSGSVLSIYSKCNPGLKCKSKGSGFGNVCQQDTPAPAPPALTPQQQSEGRRLAQGAFGQYLKLMKL